VWIVAAIAAALILALLGYLLWLRSRHERTLERAQRALRTASGSTPDTLMLLDAQRVVRFANRALFGLGAAPVLGSSLERNVSRGLWASLQAGMNEVYEHQRPSTVSISVADERGAVRQFEVRCVPVIEGALLVGATLRCIDMTEVRSLEREVLDISTRERQRLSSELHDGLGQELTGISLLLRNLVTAIDRGKPGTRLLLDEIMDYTNRAIVTTRDIARGLSPMQVERGSLSGALARLAAEAGQRLHLEIAASSDPEDIVVPEEAADHLYRIAFEAITNAARHSGCTRIGVALRRDGGTLHLTVDDDGCGMVPGDAPGTGLGLKTMAYRARLLGGTFGVEATEAGGARVRVMVPVGVRALPDEPP
jgi:two-component system, NarL family, sensor histidine kinase UhpB